MWGSRDSSQAPRFSGPASPGAPADPANKPVRSVFQKAPRAEDRRKGQTTLGSTFRMSQDTPSYGKGPPEH